MSPLLDEVLGLSSDENEGGQSIEWIRWPSGREQIRGLPVRSWDGGRALSARAALMARRGVEVVPVVYSQGMRIGTASEAVQDSWRAAQGIRAACGSAPAVSRERVTDLWHREAWQLKVSGVTSARPEILAVQVLDQLEAMIGSAGDVENYHGKMMLTFEGFEKDAREVWDVPEVKEVVRRVGQMAKWWPLTTHFTHGFVWLACLLDHEGTGYLPDGEVFLRFDRGELEGAIKAAGAETAAVMTELGMGGDLKARILQERMAPLVGFARRFSEQLDQVDKGQLEVTSAPGRVLDPLLWRDKFGGQSVDEMTREALEQRLSTADVIRSVEQGLTGSFGVVVDRSPIGEEAVDVLQRAGGALRSSLSSDAFQAWKRSKLPFVVVWGSTRLGAGATIPCDSMDTVTRLALPSCVNRCAAANLSCAWTVAVSPGQEMEVLKMLAALGANRRG